MPMLLSLSLLLALGQTPAVSQAAPPAPLVRPSLSNPELHRALDLVEEASSAKDGARAKRLLNLLPKVDVVVSWDDSKVPAADKAAFATARNEAFAMWSQAEPRLKFRLGAKPDVRFSFEPELSPRTEGGLPAGVVTFFSEDPTGPRTEAVIGLRRGRPGVPSTPTHVKNDVAFALGYYLGLNTIPIGSSVMGRTDAPNQFATQISAREALSLRQILAMTQGTRVAVEKGEVLRTTRPALFTEVTALDLGQVVQGNTLRASLQIANNGNGPLTYSMTPDCGCIRTSPPATLGPNETRVIFADFDSTDFVGEQNKRIFLFTNDPERTQVVIPVKVRIQPAYRLVRPEGNVLVTEKGKGSAEVYLWFPEGKEMELGEPRIIGLKGTITQSPWRGPLADAELNEGPVVRQGYRYTLEFDTALPVGRGTATLVIPTKNEAFPTLRFPLTLQNGIVAQPFSLLLNDLGPRVSKATVLVTRPNAPFRVLSATSNSPFLSATFEPTKGGTEYRVEIVFNGKAPSGQLDAIVTLKTDDPKQPTIDIPVRGIVG